MTTINRVRSRRETGRWVGGWACRLTEPTNVPATTLCSDVVCLSAQLCHCFWCVLEMSLVEAIYFSHKPLERQPELLSLIGLLRLLLRQFM
jgi:hypothetical protein